METVFITGANRGIGLELTRQFLDRGYRVHATYRSNIGGLGEIESEYLNLHQLDVRDYATIPPILQEIDETIDILVNNAGIADGRWPSLSEIDAEQAIEVLEVNSVAPVMMVQSALKNLKRSNNPRIAMVSSLMGSISDCMSGRSYAYRASKSALNMFSIAMMNELREDGISILILHPGWVQTDMGGPNATLSRERSASDIIERIEEQTLMMTGRYVKHDGTHIEW